MKNKIIYGLITILCLLTIQSHSSVFATETDHDENSESTSQEILIATDNFEATDSAILFNDYVPYGQFVSYQYQGDGTFFSNQDIIMEYAPDANGIFQVSSITDNHASAYIYQIRENGLYELARFEDYYMVEDLRYSQAASDGVDSLILPREMKIGLSYQTGYNQESSRYIAEYIPEYYFGGHTFNGVFRIEEMRMNNGISETYNFYYAPTYGVILMERTDVNGQNQLLMQIISTQGSLQ